MPSSFSSTRNFLISISFVLGVAGASLAQSPEDYQTEIPGPTQQIVPPAPVEFGFTQDHSSTALEGALRGKAAVIQARGNFELSASQARILNEQARWLNRENDLKQTRALLYQKQLWSDACRAERRVHDTRVTEGKLVLANRRATVYREAYRLSSSELNLTTGEINWPAALQYEELSAERAKIEELFREHTSYGDPQAKNAEEIATAVDQLSRRLRSEIASIPSNEYLAAQKFLRGLKCEAEGIVSG